MVGKKRKEEAMREYLFTATLYIAILVFTATAGAPGIGPELMHASDFEPPGRELFMRDSQGEIVEWSDIADGGRVEYYSVR